MRNAALLTLAAALALSACGREEREEEAPVVNNSAEVPVETISEPEAPAPVNASNVAAPAPPPEFSDEEQMRDDADATGLTARLPDGDSDMTGSTANEMRPAD